MATKITTTGSSTIKSGVSSSVEDPKTYDDVFTSKYTFTEANGVGANAFKIHSDTVAVVLSLKGTSGDVIIIDGYSGDYTAKLAGSKLTLVNNNQVITVALAAKSVVTLKFLDGSKDVNLVEKTLGDEPLVTKSGVLHINGVSSHELTSVTTAVKTALTDVNKKNYATVDAAIISDNTLVKSNALTDKSGKSYATVDAAIADAKTQALAPYSTLDLAIQSNDGTVITKAVTDSGTGFTSLADLVAAYNQLTPISRPTFKVESLNATMVPTSPAIVNEGDKANFKISLVGNMGSGDYTVRPILVPGNGATNNDFQSLTFDPALNPGLSFIGGVLTIPAKSTVTSAILTAKINNNLSLDTGKTINLTLSEPKGDLNATLMTAATTANFTIKDVTPATFSVTPNIGPVLEGTSTTFTVTLANHALSPYSVKVALTGNNAFLNSDFSALTLDPTTPATIKFIKIDSTTGILTIPADSKTTSVKFNTNILTDIIAEKTQSGVTLALLEDKTNSANENTVITPATSSTTTVITDITPAFSVTAGSSTVDEGKPASFTVSLANATTGDYKVNLAATTLNSSFSNTLALDSTNSNTGITFAGGILTIPTKTITDANTAKTPIKATLTSLTSPIDNTSISLALLNPTGTNVATAPAPATISINSSPATLLTTDINTIITTPDNSNTLIIGTALTLNTGDSVTDKSATDNDVMNITTNTWPATTATAKALSIDGIETINLTALGTINVDLSLLKNNKYFNVKDSTAPVTLANIPNAAIVLGLGGSQVNQLTAQFTKALVKTADSLEVTLDKANNADFTLNIDKADKPFGLVTLNVVSASSLKSFDASGKVITPVPTAPATLNPIPDPTQQVSILTISGNGALTVQDNALKYIKDIELSNTNVIKFGKIGDSTDPTTNPFLTTFKAPTNIEGITTGLIQGATGGFTMQLGSGADSISVQDNAATATNINDIRLGARDDILNFSTPTTGKTYISGDDGNDTIIISLTTAGSSTSINTIDGGSGDDRITIAIDPTITTISSSFIIIGGMGSDSISGSIGSDTIDGGDGNDNIYGSGGIDNITGGAGNDTIYVNNNGAATITDFKVGEDTLTISSGATAKVSFAGGSTSYTTVSNSGILDITLAAAASITGSTGNDLINGSIGADSIDGGLGNNTINAGDGNDVIIGGDGSDSIDGGSGDDTITAGNGVDNITGGAGNDTIALTLAQLFTINNGVATNSIDTINGGNDTDSILITDTENPVNVIITIASSLSNITGTEQLKAGPNRFPISISVDANNKFNTIDLSNDTNAGGTNIITRTGISNISTIIGSAGVDQITLSSSAFAATITGGSGADVFVINNNAINTITDLSGTDSVAVSSVSTVNATVTANYTAASAANTGTINITTAGFSVNMGAETGTTGSISITNTGAATTLVGGAGSNTINGGAGNDMISGGAGSATINGGDGNDIITAGTAGNNSITGGYGDDTITCSSGVDTINVDYGTDTITNFTPNNVSSPDVLNINYYATASVFASTIATGGTSSYATITNNGTLYINGATLSNGTTVTGTETITGSTGVDSIVGGAGADTITGGAGADTITGGAGADTITGGAGNDNISLTETTAASDKVIFSGNTLALNGTDTITGFKAGQTNGDSLAFTSLTSGALVNAIASNVITLATTTALSTEGTSIAVATNKVYVAQVANVANINSAENVITALTNTGVLDAVDVDASADAFLVLSAVDDATHVYVYGVHNDSTAAVIIGELVLLGTVTVDSTTLTSGNFAFS